eukprot:gene19415-24579_t
MDFETRDFYIQVDPATFFTTDHHRNYPCILARAERVEEDWLRQHLRMAWQRNALKRLQKAHPDMLK